MVLRRRRGLLRRGLFPPYAVADDAKPAVCWRRPSPPLLAAVGLTALVVLAVRSEREERDRPLAVVAEDGVLLRKGDGLAYPPRYETPLNKGVEARRLFERDGWVQIELSGGEVGWAPREDVLIDEP